MTSACQRVPSDVTIGDTTNICDFQQEIEESFCSPNNYLFQYQSDFKSNNIQFQEQNEFELESLQFHNDSNLKSENQQFQNESFFKSKITNSLESQNHQSQQSREKSLSSLSVYHNHSYIGQIILDHKNQNIYDSNINPLDHLIPLDYYVIRYFKVIDYYRKLNEFKFAKSNRARLNVPDKKPSSADMQFKVFFKRKGFINEGSKELSNEQILEQSLNTTLEDCKHRTSKTKQKGNRKMPSEELNSKLLGIKSHVEQLDARIQMKTHIERSKLSKETKTSRFISKPSEVSRLKPTKKMKAPNTAKEHCLGTSASTKPKSISSIIHRSNTSRSKPSIAIKTNTSKTVPLKSKSSQDSRIQTSSPVYSSKDAYILELVWLRRCIKAYLPNIRQLYDHYSQFVDSDNSTEFEEREPPFEFQSPFRPIMNRLVFWQMLRDFGLHKLFNSLVALEMEMWHNPYLKPDVNVKTKEQNFGRGNKSEIIQKSDHTQRNKRKSTHIHITKISKDQIRQGALMDPWDPFQTISFSTFVHYLLEISWILFSGKTSSQKTNWPTHLSGCLCQLMTGPFRKQTKEGKVLRNACYRRLIPAVFTTFSREANPLPLRNLLRMLKDNKLQQSEEMISTSDLWRIIHEPERNRSGEKNKSLIGQKDQVSNKSENLNEFYNKNLSVKCEYGRKKFDSHNDRTSCDFRHKLDKASHRSVSTDDSCASNMTSTDTAKTSLLSVLGHVKTSSKQGNKYTRKHIDRGNGSSTGAPDRVTGQKVDTHERSCENLLLSNKCLLQVTKPKCAQLKGLRQDGSILVQGVGGQLHANAAASANKSLSIDVEKNFFKLEMPEILRAVDRVCPKLTCRGVVVNIDIKLNFLEYYELIVNLCEVNAEKCRRLVKLGTYTTFHNKLVAPLMERERLAARERRKNKGLLRNQQKRQRL